MIALEAIKRTFPTAWIALALGLMVATPTGAAVEIIRDETGMPHVYGDTNYEVFYGFGYILAKDRMFQLEMRKRQAWGTVAEILGPGDERWPDKFIVKDLEARLRINRDEVVAEFEALPMGDKVIISAFADGINRALEEMLRDNTLSTHFSRFDLKPERWTVHDTLATAIDVLSAYSAFSTQLVNLKLYRFLRHKYPNDCDDLFDQLLWANDPNAITTAGDHRIGGLNPDRIMAQGCGTVPNGLRLPDKPSATTALQFITPPRLQPMRASMSWAVGAEKAEGFKSIFVNGPQPGWHSPGYFYPIGLHGGDFDLVGLAPEGTFVVEAGANRAFSWGTTAGLSSQVDHYEERMNADGTQYYYDGTWKPVGRRQEIIKVRGQDPVVKTIRYTVHGPIVADDSERNLAYSRKVAWRGRAARSIMAWVDAGKAQSFENWLSHARSFAFNYNWFYADRDGNIGFVHTGLFPKRRNDHDHLLPASGDGSFEWEGYLPPDDIPFLLTRDYFANFNNKPRRNWPHSGLFWEQWGEANQVEILIDALEACERCDWDEV
ncbi:MAG: hypothetical protein D6763_01845 [Alphaproteobacteria bacterium]|nr:MAG: hypothetical protein D6763_01845 [Alphaproteobacteria bacterium]